MTSEYQIPSLTPAQDAEKIDRTNGLFQTGDTTWALFKKYKKDAVAITKKILSQYNRRIVYQGWVYKEKSSSKKKCYMIVTIEK